MGSNNSTRRITVPNEEGAGVIKVSDAVAQRLKGTEGESGEVDLEAKSKCDVRAANTQPPPLDFGNHTLGQYAPPGSLLALQIRQEKLRELKDNDAYWRERIRKQTETNKIINRQLQEEYEMAVEDVKKSFIGCPDPDAVVPCQEAKDVVMNCYRKNKKSALNCSKEVIAFQECVDNTRVKKIEGRE